MSNRFSQASLETRKVYNEENVEDSNKAIPFRLFWPFIEKVVKDDITDLLPGRALTLPNSTPNAGASEMFQIQFIS